MNIFIHNDHNDSNQKIVINILKIWRNKTKKHHENNITNDHDIKLLSDFAFVCHSNNINDKNMRYVFHILKQVQPQHFLHFEHNFSGIRDVYCEWQSVDRIFWW